MSEEILLNFRLPQLLTFNLLKTAQSLWFLLNACITLANGRLTLQYRQLIGGCIMTFVEYIQGANSK